MVPGFEILHEDNHLLVVSKPAGLLVQGDSSGDPTLLDAAREYLRVKYDKPGNVYVGLVHRLDRNVSGVVALARTSKAAGRLSKQFRDGGPKKTYLAVVCGAPPVPRGELRSWLAAKADHRGVTRASEREFAGAKEAVLRYEVLATFDGRRSPCPRQASLVRIRLVTGRRHQIRAQMAQVGCPLLGDRKYGCSAGLPERRIALHAVSLALEHPVGERALVFEAPLPGDWPWSGPAPESASESTPEPEVGDA